MSETEMKSVELSFSSEEFEEYAEFLSKVKLQKIDKDHYNLLYPKHHFRNYQQLWRYLHFLLFHWFVVTAQEKEALAEKGKTAEYAR